MGVETLPARAPPPERAEPFSTYAIESLRRDIEESARADEAWEQLHAAPPERVETRLHQYPEALDEIHQETLTVARADGVPAETLHRINAVYGAEMVHAWIRCGGDVGALRVNVIQRRLVERQHAVQRLLLSAPESEAREFWGVYRDLFRSAGTEAAGTEEQRRASILGPVGVAHALTIRNGWEATPPEDPEDDQLLAVDLVVRTPQGATMVIQVETVGAPGALAWEQVSTDPDQPPAWPEESESPPEPPGLRTEVPPRSRPDAGNERPNLRTRPRSRDRHAGRSHRRTPRCGGTRAPAHGARLTVFSVRPYHRHAVLSLEESLNGVHDHAIRNGTSERCDDP